MQVILEWSEIEKHVRRSLALDGIKIPEKADMVVRKNNKPPRQTVRLVFKIPVEERVSRPGTST